MHCLLAHANCKATKAGVSFTWTGAWEYDQMSGSGHVTLGKDGQLKGTFRIKNGDSSTFIASRADAPTTAISDPPELPRQVAVAVATESSKLSARHPEVLRGSLRRCGGTSPRSFDRRGPGRMTRRWAAPSGASLSYTS